MTTQQWSARETVQRVAGGAASVRQVAVETAARITRVDGALRSFVHVDEQELEAEISRVESLAPPAGTSPLRGLPVAIKDLIDTRGQLTTYGSPIYAGHQPDADAEVVHRLRAAGAIVVGKTVTTEFALFQPPPTRNPHDPARTPGGSSSGSAAAVAAGLVPVALGTQTAGSVIRPASYCGVVGFKPTYGLISTSGVKPLSPSFDTVGLFARDVSDVALVFAAIRADSVGTAGTVPGAGGPGGPATHGGVPVVGICRTPRWGDVDAEARAAFDALVETLSAMPQVRILEEVDLPDLAEIAEAHAVVMEREALVALHDEHTHHPDSLSASLREYLDRASSRTDAEVAAAEALIDRRRRELGDRPGGADFLLTPATSGVAPPADSTGDPWFCRPWTALHVPAISLPLLRG
ncbi:amidase, partial [Intrasporangium sp.]|uniref:amidase n=1 Tax=Intrasporangium sp. TaxID=1925024 RepID=UPI00293A5ADA